MYNKGEVWFVEFPLEEDNSQTLNRPVVVLDENTLGVLSVKITKHAARKEDPYDVPILYWHEANLRLSSIKNLSRNLLTLVRRGMLFFFFIFCTDYLVYWFLMYCSTTSLLMFPRVLM